MGTQSGRRSFVLRQCLAAAALWIVSATAVDTLAQSNYSTPGIDAAGKRLVGNLVRICESGFGFVVGEVALDLVVFTPKHVVEACQGQSSVSIKLTFYGLQGNDRQAEAHGAAAYGKPPIDAAFLQVPRPASWKNSRAVMGTDDDVARGRTVSFVGHMQKPIVSPRYGKIVEECDKSTMGVCVLLLNDLKSEVGLSGAVVFEEQGPVVGFNLSAEADDRMQVLRVDVVRRIAESLGFSWTLYTKAEVAEFGLQLNRAAQSGNLDLVDQLLAKGINPDEEYATEGGGKAYPMALASRAKQFDVVKKLMQAGAADPPASWQQALRQLARSAGSAPRLIESTVVTALNAQRFDVLDLALELKLDLGCSLYEAIDKGQIPPAQRMLAARLAGVRLDLNELCSERTPLFIAIVRGHPQLALALLEQGADPNITEMEGPFIKGHTLTAAILARQTVVVEQLLKRKVRVDVVDRISRLYRLPAMFNDVTFEIFSPVHAAAFVGDIALIDDLAKRGADPDVHEFRLEPSIHSSICGSPFEVAILSGRLDVANHLIVKHKVNPIGHRDPGWLIRDMWKRSGLTVEQRRDAEKLIYPDKKKYCAQLRRMQESDFKSRADYDDAFAGCPS